MGRVARWGPAHRGPVRRRPRPQMRPTTGPRRAIARRPVIRRPAPPTARRRSTARRYLLITTLSAIRVPKPPVA